MERREMMVMMVQGGGGRGGGDNNNNSKEKKELLHPCLDRTPSSLRGSACPQIMPLISSILPPSLPSYLS